MAKGKSKTKGKNKGYQKGESRTDLLIYFLAISPFILGLCKQYLIFGATIFVLCAILGIGMLSGKMFFYKNPSVLAGAVMLISAVIAIFTGVSHGDAVYGLARLLAAGMWVLLLMQLSKEDRERSLSILPSAAVIMVLVSALMYTMSGVRDFVFEHSRLAGFFQYSNTMALFLLIALVIFTLDGNFEKQKKWKKYSYPIILLGGILWTGSRTTFVMTVVVMLILIIRRKEVRRQYSVMMGAGVAAAAGYAILFNNTASVGRFLTIVGKSSTLMGRFLYWVDGLKLLAKHPMGLGYLGQFFVQQSTQSGVYTVRYLHNEWLQMALDYGIIFLAAFLYLFIHQLRKTKGLMRWILVMIAIHMVMDFDLQYMSMIWLLLTCMDWQEGSKIEVDFGKKKGAKQLTVSLLVVFAVLFLWLGLADFCYEIKAYDVAASIYPWSVETKEKQMLSSKTEEEFERYAKQVLKLNPYDGAAYDILALVASEQEDYMGMVKYKKQAVERQRYRTEEYEDYVAMLKTAISYYEEKDSEKYQTCVGELLQVEDMLAEVKDSTHSLAYQINDKPELELSKETVTYINSFR